MKPNSKKQQKFIPHANAKSDGANMLDIKYLEKLLKDLVAIRKTITKL